MKLLLTLIMLITSAATAASAGKEGGGGDPTEARVEEIRADLVKWINDGGSKGLKLPQHLTVNTYNVLMLNILQTRTVAIEFTDQRPSPVNINGHKKTCINFYTAVGPKILCDAERYRLLDEAEEYRLIHHEYAGLAGVEINDGPNSDYSISNQITTFLESQHSLKLSVKETMEMGEIYYRPLGRVISKLELQRGFRKLSQNEMIAAQEGIKTLLLSQNPNYNDSNSCKKNVIHPRSVWKITDFYLNKNRLIEAIESDNQRITWHTNKDNSIFVIHHVDLAKKTFFSVHFSVRSYDDAPERLEKIVVEPYDYFPSEKINFGSVLTPDYKIVPFIRFKKSVRGHEHASYCDL